jgi:hypothetical protein
MGGAPLFAGPARLFTIWPSVRLMAVIDASWADASWTSYH